MKHKNSWLVITFFSLTLIVSTTIKTIHFQTEALAQEQEETQAAQNIQIRYATLFSYHPLVGPNHPAYKAERERLKDTIAAVGEANVKIEVRGEEILMLEIGYAKEGKEGIEKKEYKVFDKEKNIWHSYAENPFTDPDAKEMYTGEPITDTVLMTLDFLTFFSRGFISDFHDNRKEIGNFIASVTFYDEKSSLFRRFFHFLQTHEDTEVNRLSFFYEIIDEYHLEKDKQPPSLSAITSNEKSLLKLKSLEGDKTQLSEPELKDIEQALTGFNRDYQGWVKIREVLSHLPAEDQARVNDFIQLKDLYDLQ